MSRHPLGGALRVSEEPREPRFFLSKRKRLRRFSDLLRRRRLRALDERRLSRPPLARHSACLLVLGVAASRIYLKVHWLSDVIGGLVGGVTYLLVVLLLIDRRLRAATP